MYKPLFTTSPSCVCRCTLPVQSFCVRLAFLEPGALRDASNPTQGIIAAKEKLWLRLAGTPFPRDLCIWLKCLTAKVSVNINAVTSS